MKWLLLIGLSINASGVWAQSMWTKTLEYDGGNASINSIQLASDGNFLINGHVSPGGLDADALIFKINANGICISI